MKITYPENTFKYFNLVRALAHIKFNGVHHPKSANKYYAGEINGTSDKIRPFVVKGVPNQLVQDCKLNSRYLKFIFSHVLH